MLADPNFDLTVNNGDVLRNDNQENASKVMVTSKSLQANAPSRHSRELRQGSIHFTELQGTRIEGEDIANMLNVSPWLGDIVLETALKLLMILPRILHIATHGFFLPNQPDNPNDKNNFIVEQSFLGQRLENPLLRSGLALAGANTWLKHKPTTDDAEDGILTAKMYSYGFIQYPASCALSL